MNKWAKWALIVFALWFLSHNPAVAGKVGHAAGQVVSGVTQGGAALINGIAPGLTR